MQWLAAREAVTVTRELLPEVKHIHIFTDNTSAIQICYLENPKAGPGHSTIVGNTIVDSEVL